MFPTVQITKYIFIDDDDDDDDIFHTPLVVEAIRRHLSYNIFLEYKLVWVFD